MAKVSGGNSCTILHAYVVYDNPKLNNIDPFALSSLYKAGGIEAVKEELFSVDTLGGDVQMDCS